VAVKIAEALNVTAEYLVTGTMANQAKAGYLKFRDILNDLEVLPEPIRVMIKAATQQEREKKNGPSEG
jgi:hypothetical protein